ncbi:hypothetical protein B2A_12784 [mine drainage metagenome]|uniref:Uncharacterized protein n=1 Tax=mine drainage metagenome TaxID=410659 RepID=T0YM44_9ZZZZ
MTGKKDGVRSKGAMPKYRKIAVFDIDGTLFNSDECIRSAELEILGKSVTRDEYFALPKGMRKRITNLAFTKYIDAAKPNYRIINILRSKKAAGYRVIILTGRSSKTEMQTIMHLNQYDVPFDELYCNKYERIDSNAFKLLKLAEVTKGSADVTIYDNSRSGIDNFTELSSGAFRVVLVKARPNAKPVALNI